MRELFPARAGMNRRQSWLAPSLLAVPSPRSNPDLLDILDGHLVGRPVVELGRARALMRGDRLGALERAAIEQIRRDAGGPEGVAIGLAEPDGLDAPLDHPEHIHPAQPARAHPARPRHRAPQGRVFLGRDPGRGEIGVEIGLRLVVDRHGVVLAALFPWSRSHQRLPCW